MACNIGDANLDLGECFLLNETQTVGSVYNTPTVLVNQIVSILFIAGGLVLFFMIMYAGYLFITGDTKGMDKSKEILQNALTGFIVMFCAYWIVQLIGYVTGAQIGI